MSEQENIFINEILRHRARLLTRSGRIIAGKFTLTCIDRRLYLDGTERIPQKEVLLISVSRTIEFIPQGNISSWDDHPVPAMFLENLINSGTRITLWLTSFSRYAGNLLFEFPYSFVLSSSDLTTLVFKHGVILLTPSDSAIDYLASLPRNLRYLPWIPPWKKISPLRLIRPAFSKKPVNFLLRGLSVSFPVSIECFSRHYVLSTLLGKGIFEYIPSATLLIMRSMLERVESIEKSISSVKT